jgi:ABC-type Fe3+/spermidine/putrescine transport system ATPase subunit
MRTHTHFVASFLGKSTCFEGRVLQIQGEYVTIALEEGLRIYARRKEGITEGQNVKLFLRAEKCTIANGQKSGIEGLNLLAGVVESQSYVGDANLLYVEVSHNSRIVVEEQTLQRGRMLLRKPEDRLYVHITPENVICL